MQSFLLGIDGKGFEDEPISALPGWINTTFSWTQLFFLPTLWMKGTLGWEECFFLSADPSSTNFSSGLNSNFPENGIPHNLVLDVASPLHAQLRRTVDSRVTFTALVEGSAITAVAFFGCWHSF